MSDELEQTPSKGPETFYNAADNAEYTADALDRFLDAGTVDAVYGEPVVHNGRMIIPAAEIISALGVGYGGGGGSAAPDAEDLAAGVKEPNFGGGGGAGGGGRIFSRPVAVVIADENGVRVEPVFDITKIGMAALTAFGFMAAMYFRMRSPGSMEAEMRRQMKELHG